MNIATITTTKGQKLNSVILNDKEGKPFGFLGAKIVGTYGEGGPLKVKTIIFDKGDEKIQYTKGVDGLIHVVKDCGDYKHEIFVELEQFKLVKVKWQENASLAACIDTESRIERLFKAAKADKDGNIWQALKGLKNDTERLAELTEWCDDEWLAKMEKAYGLSGSKAKRPETAGVKRPDSK